MTYSLNEIEALAKKAARGGGYDWGVAEETGKAVRWLASHGLPGAGVLAEHLSQQVHDGPPQILDGDWSGATGALCPLTSGITLNDCADRLTDPHGQALKNVTHPLLVVPFAAWAALHIKAPLTVVWNSVRATSNGYDLHIEGSEEDLNAAQTDSLKCSIARGNHALVAPGLRGKICPDVWAKLNTFAQRTYAPATEASRLLGAGAGVSDND
ncbi:DUF3726 domain-containing protein [Sulfitobacter mediterraneus]|jgi:Protein of unknown function (DUF3726)|uniref:DUF3726 domain-containing protein n=1 Tax=Sulfitobacter mediterraneus TaxID=83219 RepID=UPI000EA00664|nr:DUF3726 domain-containing protein [Sulfitobacter mediterraneus]